MDDILYINDKLLEQMQIYCSDKLLMMVFDDFRKEAPIVLNGDKPKYWCVTDFLRRASDVSIVNKLQVILTFINCNGCVCIDDVNYIDMSNPLLLLKNSSLITDEELGFLNDPWFDYHQFGREPHLDIVD